VTDLERKIYLLALEVVQNRRFDDAHQVDIAYLAQRDGLLPLGENIYDVLGELRPVLDRLEEQGYLIRSKISPTEVTRNSWVPIDLLTAIAKEAD
jgi:hypothetical protein